MEQQALGRPGRSREISPASNRNLTDFEAAIRREILGELEAHSRMEHDVFYPETARSPELAANAEFKALIDRSFADHRDLDARIQVIRSRLSEGFEAWAEPFSELIEEVELHLSVEEDEVFSRVDEHLGDSTAEMTERMIALKDQFMNRPEHRDVRPEVVQNPHGGEQRRFLI